MELTEAATAAPPQETLAVFRRPVARLPVVSVACCLPRPARRDLSQHPQPTETHYGPSDLLRLRLVLVVQQTPLHNDSLPHLLSRQTLLQGLCWRQAPKGFFQMIGEQGLRILQTQMQHAMIQCPSLVDSGAKVGAAPMPRTTLGAACRSATHLGQSAPQRTGTGRQMMWTSAIVQ